MKLKKHSTGSSSGLKAAACALFVTINAEAGTILHYDSNGENGLSRIDSATDNTLVSSSVAINSLGNRATFAAIHNSQNNVDGLGTANDIMFRFGSSAGGNGAMSGALTVAHMNAGPYLQLNFTAAQTIDFDGLTFKLFNNSNNASNYGARDVGLFVNVNGGAFSQFGALDTSATGNGQQGTIVFSDSRTVNAGEEVILRLTFTDRTRTNNDLQAATRIGAIDISATAIAIPEPASALLSGLGMLVMLRRRR